MSDGKASVVVLQDEAGVTLSRLDDDRQHRAAACQQPEWHVFQRFTHRQDRRVYAVTRPNIGPLHVVGMDGTEDRTLSAVPAYAFVWSPDGSKIAYISVPSEAETRPAAFGSRQDLRLTWNIVDMATGQSRALHTFEPSKAFHNSVAILRPVRSVDSDVGSKAANAWCSPITLVYGRSM